MKFCISTPNFRREKLGGFLVANFLSHFPKEKWLKICHSSNLRKFHHIPNLPFLAFLDFLAFFLFEEFLAILSVFPFFPKDFRGSASIRNPCLFGGFPCRFQKRQGKEDQGFSTARKEIYHLELALGATSRNLNWSGR